MRSLIPECAKHSLCRNGRLRDSYPRMQVSVPNSHSQPHRQGKTIVTSVILMICQNGLAKSPKRCVEGRKRDNARGQSFATGNVKMTLQAILVWWHLKRTPQPQCRHQMKFPLVMPTRGQCIPWQCWSSWLKCDYFQSQPHWYACMYERTEWSIAVRGCAWFRRCYLFRIKITSVWTWITGWKKLAPIFTESSRTLTTWNRKTEKRG